jgi:ATP-dependent RNA helicase DeaD
MTENTPLGNDSELIISSESTPTDVDFFEDAENIPQENPNAFSKLGVDIVFAEHLAKLGYTEPTPIQKEAVPVLLKNQCDFIGLASTGTGKTAAFAIPLIEKIKSKFKKPQALVLCPTRELAHQVATQISLLGQFRQIQVASIYGGASYQTQIRALKQGAQIIVATPGRLIDLLDQGLIHLEEIQFLVLDEADEMLSQGFQEALETILGKLRSGAKKAEKIEGDQKHLIWLFSATMSSSITRLTSRYLVAPKLAKLSTGLQTATQVKQTFICVAERDKLEALHRIVKIEDAFYGLVFCRRREDTTAVAQFLNSHGISAEAIHGEKTQRERESILGQFRQGRIQVLVATDVAARGLDVKDLTHVINFTLPLEVESYIHRIGRTGRNGKEGKAISLVSPSEMRWLSKIERVTNQKIPVIQPPGATEVRAKILDKVWTKLITKKYEERITNQINQLCETLELPEVLSNLSKDEIIGLFLATYEPQAIWIRDIPKIEPKKQFSSSERSPRFGGRGRSNEGGRSPDSRGRRESGERSPSSHNYGGSRRNEFQSDTQQPPRARTDRKDFPVSRDSKRGKADSFPSRSATARRPR